MAASAHISALQERLVGLLRAGAYRSAEVLAQGLLIEAPATTSTATAQNAPLVGNGSPVRTLELLADALREQGEHARAAPVPAGAAASRAASSRCAGRGRRCRRRERSNGRRGRRHGLCRR